MIMAGGRGERFWPASRRNHPKQLLCLNSSQAMIEETVQRLYPLINPENILVMTNVSYVEQIKELLTIPAENIIGEPAARNTAPCVALATALIKKRNPNAVIIMLSADHIIQPIKLFQEVLSEAVQQAKNGNLITLGIQPSYAATGYGYIHAGECVAKKFRKALQFCEKPDSKIAMEFFKNSDYLWNSGIFIWTVSAIIDAFRKYTPVLYEKILTWSSGADYMQDFAECDNISIDYAIMEKADNVIVRAVSFYWNDVGSWSSLRAILPLDSDGNAVRGEVIAVESTGNVLVSDDDCLLGVIGMENIVVIKSGNGILVCPLAREQEIKKLTAEISQQKPRFL